MVWYSHLFQIFQFIVIHTVNGFGIVNKAEIDVFLELSCFFNDPADVCNLISGSSAIWKTQQWPQDWKRSVFIPVPKKGNAKVCSNEEMEEYNPNERIRRSLEKELIHGWWTSACQG